MCMGLVSKNYAVILISSFTQGHLINYLEFMTAIYGCCIFFICIRQDCGFICLQLQSASIRRTRTRKWYIKVQELHVPFELYWVLRFFLHQSEKTIIKNYMIIFLLRIYCLICLHMTQKSMMCLLFTKWRGKIRLFLV